MKLARELLLCVLFVAAGAWPAIGQTIDRSVALAPAEVELLDATSATHLENATRFLAEKQWDEAVDAIRRAMEGDGGRFVQVQDAADDSATGFQRLVPVREFCQWRLAALAREAPEALAHYRSLADPLAEQWLRQASENRDERLLKRIVSDAFATSAGDEALLRLGDLALARGEFASARGYFARIGPQLVPPGAAANALPPPPSVYPDTNLAPETVRARLVLVSILAGKRQRAEQELAQFRSLHGGALGELAGRSGNLAELLAALLAQSQDWPTVPLPEDWLTFAGNPARNATAGGPIEPATQPRWTFNVPRLEAERDVIGAGRLRVADDAQGLLSYFPLIVGDTALVRVDARGLSSIVALDLASGEVRWQVDAPRAPGRTDAPPDADSDDEFEVSDAHAGLLRHVGVARHTLTVHEGKLFARMGSPVTAPPRPETILSKSQGFLMGYDLASEGKPLDGFPIRPESGEWSFEGTPLCDGANLYVAMRRIEQGRCQMHVACLALATSGAAIDDADDNARPTGRMLWRTKICSAGTLGMGDLPELSHVLLSMDGGTVFVNTQLGAVAAIDAATGNAAWICKYPRATFKSGDPDRHDDHFFRDLTPCLVAGDLVIFAPADCDRLFALDRATGSLAWATEPGVAADAVHFLGTSGNWLIASGDRLYWIDLASGSVAARFPNTPSGGPMHAAANPRGLGRGLMAGDHVYWPTREAIYVFRGSPRHAADGSFVPDGTGEIPLELRGATGGNLVFARDTLLIATGDKLHAFDCRQQAASGE